MLKDVIEFIVSRTSMTREDALRDINYAWKECWNSDDLPNSLFELTLTPIDSNARISLPGFVGELRAVKQNSGRIRVALNTPRPYYHDEVYSQSPYTWRVLGNTPLSKSITNATTIDLTFTEPLAEAVTVSLIGPNDNGTEVREQLKFVLDDITKRSVNRYVDLDSIAKDKITATDLRVLNSSEEEIGLIPNSAFTARNTICQIMDKRNVSCNSCKCFDVLYKKTTPYLYFDETFIPFEEVLMAKTMEWISMPKDGQEQKTIMFSTKARELITQFNVNEQGIEHKLDIGASSMRKSYSGYL